MGLGVDDELAGTGRTVADELLSVHRGYLKECRSLERIVTVRGLAHITGGGLLENIPRILPAGCSVEIDTKSWRVPTLFDLLQEKGKVERTEMFRVFNMGIGMIFIIPAGEESRLAAGDFRYDPFRVGTVIDGSREVVLKG